MGYPLIVPFRLWSCGQRSDFHFQQLKGATSGDDSLSKSTGSQRPMHHIPRGGTARRIAKMREFIDGG
jgi:hypothetical protein